MHRAKENLRVDDPRVRPTARTSSAACSFSNAVATLGAVTGHARLGQRIDRRRHARRFAATSFRRVIGPFANRASRRRAGLHSDAWSGTSLSRSSCTRRSMFANASRRTFHASGAFCGSSTLSGTGTCACDEGANQGFVAQPKPPSAGATGGGREPPQNAPPVPAIQTVQRTTMSSAVPMILSGPAEWISMHVPAQLMEKIRRAPIIDQFALGVEVHSFRGSEHRLVADFYP